MKIFVVGHTGMVGKTVFSYFKEREHNVVGYSLENKDDDFDSLIQGSEVIFVCVPTPFNWETKNVDLSIVDESLKKIDIARREGKLLPDTIVCLKSTVLPTTTERLQNMFFGLNLFFNPEFLSESTHNTDFAYPDRQIVGYTKKQGAYKEMKLAEKLLNLLPYSVYRVIVPATEAEIDKYVNNFYGSIQVTFANMIKDICDMTGQDYQGVFNASRASETIGRRTVDRWWNIAHKGFRGYGGKCFPKDMQSLNKWLEEKGYSRPFLIKGMIEFNQNLLAEQNQTEMSVETSFPLDTKETSKLELGKQRK